jgi:hypothetical protein
MYVRGRTNDYYSVCSSSSRETAGNLRTSGGTSKKKRGKKEKERRGKTYVPLGVLSVPVVE